MACPATVSPLLEEDQSEYFAKMEQQVLDEAAARKVVNRLTAVVGTALAAGRGVPRIQLDGQRLREVDLMHLSDQELERVEVFSEQIGGAPMDVDPDPLDLSDGSDSEQLNDQEQEISSKVGAGEKRKAITKLAGNCSALKKMEMSMKSSKSIATSLNDATVKTLKACGCSQEAADYLIAMYLSNPIEMDKAIKLLKKLNAREMVLEGKKLEMSIKKQEILAGKDQYNSAKKMKHRDPKLVMDNTASLSTFGAAPPAVPVSSPPAVPQHLTCSISGTGQPMVDPVMTSAGHTYERAAIETWLATHDSDPNTNTALPNKNLTPNVNVRQAIADFIDNIPVSTANFDSAGLDGPAYTGGKAGKDCIDAAAYQIFQFKDGGTPDNQIGDLHTVSVNQAGVFSHHHVVVVGAKVYDNSTSVVDGCCLRVCSLREYMGRFSAPGTNLLYKQLRCVSDMKDELTSNHKSFNQENLSFLLAVYHCDGYEKFENSKFLQLDHHQESFNNAMVDMPVSKREQPVSKRAESSTMTAPCGKLFTANGTVIPFCSIRLHCKLCEHCEINSLVSIIAKNAGAKDTRSYYDKSMSTGALHCFYANGDKLDPKTSQFTIGGIEDEVKTPGYIELQSENAALKVQNTELEQRNFDATALSIKFNEELMDRAATAEEKIAGITADPTNTFGEYWQKFYEASLRSLVPEGPFEGGYDLSEDRTGDKDDTDFLDGCYYDYDGALHSEVDTWLSSGGYVNQEQLSALVYLFGATNLYELIQERTFGATNLDDGSGSHVDVEQKLLYFKVYEDCHELLEPGPKGILSTFIQYFLHNRVFDFSESCDGDWTFGSLKIGRVYENDTDTPDITCERSAYAFMVWAESNMNRVAFDRCMSEGRLVFESNIMMHFVECDNGLSSPTAILISEFNEGDSSSDSDSASDGEALTIHPSSEEDDEEEEEVEENNKCETCEVNQQMPFCEYCEKCVNKWTTDDEEPEPEPEPEPTCDSDININYYNILNYQGLFFGKNNIEMLQLKQEIGDKAATMIQKMVRGHTSRRFDGEEPSTS